MTSQDPEFATGAYQRPPRHLTFPLYDPGAFVPRRHDIGPEQDEAEPLTWWQARAVIASLAQDEVVERVAKALAEANNDGCFDPDRDDEAEAEDRDYYRLCARAALADLSGLTLISTTETP